MAVSALALLAQCFHFFPRKFQAGIPLPGMEIGSLGVFDLAEGFITGAEVGVGQGIVGIAGDCLLIGGNGVAVALLLMIG